MQKITCPVCTGSGLGRPGSLCPNCNGSGIVAAGARVSPAAAAGASASTTVANALAQIRSDADGDALLDALQLHALTQAGHDDDVTAALAERVHAHASARMGIEHDVEPPSDTPRRSRKKKTADA